MQLSTISNTPTMSSLEIATLTGKNHADVLRDIRNILTELKIGESKFAGTYSDVQNKARPCFNLPKREALILTSGYSISQRASIIDKWQELESKQAFQIPQTFSAALRLAGELQEQVEQLQLEAKENAPRVEFANAVRRMEGACKIGDFGKVIGIGRNTLYAKLRADEILMIDNMPYQKYVDAGWFTVIEQIPYCDRDGKSHPAFTTMVTGKGQVALEKKYRAKD